MEYDIHGVSGLGLGSTPPSSSVVTLEGLQARQTSLSNTAEVPDVGVVYDVTGRLERAKPSFLRTLLRRLIGKKETEAPRIQYPLEYNTSPPRFGGTTPSHKYGWSPLDRATAVVAADLRALSTSPPAYVNSSPSGVSRASMGAPSQNSPGAGTAGANTHTPSPGWSAPGTRSDTSIGQGCRRTYVSLLSDYLLYDGRRVCEVFRSLDNDNSGQIPMEKLDTLFQRLSLGFLGGALPSVKRTIITQHMTQKSLRLREILDSLREACRKEDAAKAIHMAGVPAVSRAFVRMSISPGTSAHVSSPEAVSEGASLSSSALNGTQPNLAHSDLNSPESLLPAKPSLMNEAGSPMRHSPADLFGQIAGSSPATPEGFDSPAPSSRKNMGSGGSSGPRRPRVPLSPPSPAPYSRGQSSEDHDVQTPNMRHVFPGNETQSHATTGEKDLPNQSSIDSAIGRARAYRNMLGVDRLDRRFNKGMVTERGVPFSSSSKKLLEEFARMRKDIQERNAAALEKVIGNGHAG